MFTSIRDNRMERKNAVILMAYGSPDKPEDIEPYYTHIRGGRKPSPQELVNLSRRYMAIGGRSPLLEITLSTAKKLETKLGRGIRVYAGMKHWHPFVSEVFDEISRDEITDLLAIPLAPHYSKMSIGSYQDAVKGANASHGNKVRLELVNDWYRNDEFLKAWTRRIEETLDRKFPAKPEHCFVLFTAHSLPERILSWGDPYKNQLLETADLLAKNLRLETNQYSFAFQSAGHTAEPWLGPDILAKVRDLKDSGCREILIAPVGFVSDHLEILFDIDVEAKNLSKELGIHLERTESFNDSDEFIGVLASVARYHQGFA
jgi:protoporphyrin/coproporphyrin ferrochelatase